MTDPNSEQPRNKLPEETAASRGFPFLAPLIIVVLALVILGVYWLSR